MENGKNQEEGTLKKKPSKPWPLSWVLIAILLYALIHTLVSLIGN